MKVGKGGRETDSVVEDFEICQEPVSKEHA
jgi:hypothetical protein